MAGGGAVLTPDDKAPPKGALEEAVLLCDELISLLAKALESLNAPPAGEWGQQFYQLRRRRAALEPRLAKRRENQAKPRGGEK